MLDIEEDDVILSYSFGDGSTRKSKDDVGVFYGLEVKIRAMVVRKKMTYVVFLRGPIPFHVASVHFPTLVWWGTFWIKGLRV